MKASNIVVEEIKAAKDLVNCVLFPVTCGTILELQENFGEEDHGEDIIQLKGNVVITTL